MTQICFKCKKEFNSLSNLDRHLNRILSCDLILKCKTCNVIFKKQNQLDSHLNRKFPCKMVDIDLEKYKYDKDLELRLLLANEKIANNIRISEENKLKLSFMIEKEKIK